MTREARQRADFEPIGPVSASRSAYMQKGQTFYYNEDRTPEKLAESKVDRTLELVTVNFVG